MPPAAEAPQDLLPHDIAGPVWYLPYPLPVMIAIGCGILLLLGVAVWLLVRWLRRQGPPPTPRERALASLAAAKTRAAEAEPYPFSIEVCDVLREYLGTEHKLPAPKLTSLEFLQMAQSVKLFDDRRLSDLAKFLEKADAIKFARAAAGAADNIELAGLAEELVRGGAPADA
jgi:hypothetical protein